MPEYPVVQFRATESLVVLRESSSGWIRDQSGEKDWREGLEGGTKRLCAHRTARERRSSDLDIIVEGRGEGNGARGPILAFMHCNSAFSQ